MPRHAQSTYNKMFAKLFFLPADKFQRLLQSDIIILGVCGQSICCLEMNFLRGF